MAVPRVLRFEDAEGFRGVGAWDAGCDGARGAEGFVGC